MLFSKARHHWPAKVSIADRAPLLDFFLQRINNALFRHQALHWIADLGLNLRLYGKGWEKHPRFGRFARGPADNETQIGAIYRASRINLQVNQAPRAFPKTQ